jgi:hypothetical protein
MGASRQVATQATVSRQHPPSAQHQRTPAQSNVFKHQFTAVYRVSGLGKPQEEEPARPLGDFSRRAKATFRYCQQALDQFNVPFYSSEKITKGTASLSAPYDK